MTLHSNNALSKAKTPNVAKADGKQVELKIKSAFLYNFLKYIEVEGSEPFNKKDYSVCVLGVDPFGKALQEVKGKKAKGRPVTVHQMFDVNKTDNCDVIYISQSKKLELLPVLKEINKRSVLTVSDIENFTQVGGIVRFIDNNGKVGIEVNLTQARKSGIQISALLLEIAKVIEERTD